MAEVDVATLNRSLLEMIHGATALLRLDELWHNTFMLQQRNRFLAQYRCDPANDMGG